MLFKNKIKSEKVKSCTPECRWFSFCVRMCVRVWYERDEIFRFDFRLSLSFGFNSVLLNRRE